MTIAFPGGYAEVRSSSEESEAWRFLEKSPERFEIDPGHSDLISFTVSVFRSDGNEIAGFLLPGLRQTPSVTGHEGWFVVAGGAAFHAVELATGRILSGNTYWRPALRVAPGRVYIVGEQSVTVLLTNSGVLQEHDFSQMIVGFDFVEKGLAVGTEDGKTHLIG